MGGEETVVVDELEFALSARAPGAKGVAKPPLTRFRHADAFGRECCDCAVEFSGERAAVVSSV